MVGNPISMSLLQWSWENYAFGKINSPSSAVEGIMTLNLFISLNCQQFSVAIDSLTLKWSGTVNICNKRLAVTELQQLCFQGVSSFSCPLVWERLPMAYHQLQLWQDHSASKGENRWNQKCSQNRKIIFKSKSLKKWPFVHNKPSQQELWVWNLKFKIHIWWLKIKSKKHEFTRTSHVRVSAGEQLMTIPPNFSRHWVMTTLFRQESCWTKIYFVLKLIHPLLSNLTLICTSDKGKPDFAIVRIHNKTNGPVFGLL